MCLGFARISEEIVGFEGLAASCGRGVALKA